MTAAEDAPVQEISAVASSCAVFYRLEEGDVRTFPLPNHGWVDIFSSVTSGYFSHGTRPRKRIRAETQSA